MAPGIPLVTTRVGQAHELVANGRNGLLVEVDDAEAIARAVLRVPEDRAVAQKVRAMGRRTSEQHSYECLDELWSVLLDTFVDRI